MKSLAPALVALLAMNSGIAQAAQELSCIVSILRQHKDLPDPSSPEGRVVIARPDGTVISVIENRREQVLSERFTIDLDSRKTLNAAFGDDMEAVVAVKEVIGDDDNATRTVISTLEVRMKAANGQKRALALGRQFSPGNRLKLTVFNSELATAALKIGMDDVMSDMARPVLEGALASGSMLFATLECR
jgi:hypothetical protein